MNNVQMTYEEAKELKQKLEEKNIVDSNVLKSFEKYGLSPIGGTPDHVKAMPEWKEAKIAFDHSFNELRNFNGWFVKKFKKEYTAERRNKYKIS